MSDRTLAIVVGSIAWLAGFTLCVLGWLLEVDLIVMGFGAAIGIIGGMLVTHGRRVPNP